MATGTQAIDAIAAATGIPAPTVDRIARVLKQHEPGLWPRSGQGGGRKAKHVQQADLINLVLALAIADPFTEAPGFVAAYRALTPAAPTVSRSSIMMTGRGSVTTTQAESVPAHADKFSADSLATGDFAWRLSLGEHLEVVTLMLSASGGFSQAMRDHHRTNWTCDLYAKPTALGSPFAVIRSVAPDGQVFIRHFSPAERDLFGMEIGAESAPPAPLLRSTRISFALLETLGGLLADTRDRSATPLFNEDSEPADIAEPDMKAAEVGASAAFVSGPLAPQTLASPEGFEHNLARVLRASDEAHAGRSPIDRRENQHESRHHPAAAAAARAA